jgi:hypothetical protein
MQISRRNLLIASGLALLAAVVLVGGCGGPNEQAGTTSPTTARSAATSGPSSTSTANGTPQQFTAQVWADNWFALYANGKLVGEDSVPITTERSFNAETITFDATYPLTIAMVTKDFKENDTGLEYIGTPRQQMGDGGVIAQVTETATGKVVAVTGPEWRGLVVHRAPLDTACETSASPATECTSEVAEEPTGWTSASFDDSKWTPATVYTEDEVQPKDGYSEVTWDPSATLIWSASLTQDNTILWRTTVP